MRIKYNGGEEQAEVPRQAFKYEDFVDPSPELPPDASLVDKVLALECQVSGLKAQVAILEATSVRVEKLAGDWFREQAVLTFEHERDAAAKQFRTDVVQQSVQQAVEVAVESVFQREAQELARHIYSQVLKALKR
jgi:hypothetical protein